MELHSDEMTSTTKLPHLITSEIIFVYQNVAAAFLSILH